VDVTVGFIESVEKGRANEESGKVSSIVGFFRQIHRAIFDPSFYREVPVMARRQIVFFVLKLFVLATLLGAIAHTYYLFDAKRGVAGSIATMFKGLEIKGGSLIATHSLPYKLDESLVSSIFYRLVFDLPMIAEMAPAPSVIVDTSSKAQRPKGNIPAIIMKSREILVAPTPSLSIPFSYSRILDGSSDAEFSEKAIKGLLAKNFLTLFFYACIFEGFPCAFMALFCICILAFAAYIFRFERERRLSHYVRFASFAIAPVPIGAILIALSDVKLPGAWDILVVVSFAVMFRAVMATVQPENESDAGEE
jgi:hypothetical protein